MGLGRNIALGGVFGLFVTQVPCLASDLIGCDMKGAQKRGAAEAAVRKPARPAEAERARAERAAPIYYTLAPSRRIILQ